MNESFTMTVTNYFELFGLPVTFHPDLQMLKKAYYKLSRQFHPDFHTDASPEEQAKMAETSEYINRGFEILSDSLACTKYILEWKGMMTDVGGHSLPQDFLFEMMDINEQIDDLHQGGSQENVSEVLQSVSEFEGKLTKELDFWTSQFENGSNQEESLHEIKILYLKSKYLLRIRENISTFAAP